MIRLKTTNKNSILFICITSWISSVINKFPITHVIVKRAEASVTQPARASDSPRASERSGGGTAGSFTSSRQDRRRDAALAARKIMGSPVKLHTG